MNRESKNVFRRWMWLIEKDVMDAGKMNVAPLTGFAGFKIAVMCGIGPERCPDLTSPRGLLHIASYLSGTPNIGLLLTQIF